MTRSFNQPRSANQKTDFFQILKSHNDNLGGRFTDTARSSGGTLDVKFLIDSQGRIFNNGTGIALVEVYELDFD